jgi:hypothetical protein
MDIRKSSRGIAVKIFYKNDALTVNGKAAPQMMNEDELEVYCQVMNEIIANNPFVGMLLSEEARQ